MPTLNEIETLICAQEEQRYAAIPAGDFDIFVKLAHPDLRYARSNGIVDSVESYIKSAVTGTAYTIKLSTLLRLYGLRARYQGNTAVI